MSPLRQIERPDGGITLLMGFVGDELNQRVSKVLAETGGVELTDEHGNLIREYGGSDGRS